VLAWKISSRISVGSEPSVAAVALDRREAGERSGILAEPARAPHIAFELKMWIYGRSTLLRNGSGREDGRRLLLLCDMERSVTTAS